MNLLKNFKSILIISISISIFLNANIALAADENIKFDNLSTEDGLSQSCVSDIFQDSYGYIWIGTEDGLNRYDGHKFKIYKYKQGINSIKSNIIAAIDDDKEGNILVGTSKGFDVINKGTEEIKNYTYNSQKAKESLSHYNIWDILVDYKNRIWIATENGLNLYDKHKNTFTKIEYKRNKNSNDFITTLDEDEFGDIWIGSKVGLFKYNYDKKEYSEYYFDKNNKNTISENYISKVCADKKGYVWVGTKNSGLNKINLKNNNITRFKHEQNNKNALPSDSITTLLKDSRDCIWIGTNKGLVKHFSNDKFKTYKKSVRDDHSLSNNDITALLEDKSGVIWVGTKSGINKFNSKCSFKHYKRCNEDESIENFNKFSDKMMQGIYEDDEGILWLGTNNGGINRFDRRNNTVKIYKNSKNNNSLSNNQVWMVTGKKENVWIATSNGLNKFDKGTKRFKAYFHNDNNQNSLICNEVKSLLIDKEGILWIGTREGLCTLDQNGDFKNYNFLFAKAGIIDKFITSIYEDRDGIIWFGCAINGGVIKYNRKTRELKNYKHNDEDKNSISFNSIKCINEDLLGNIWIATNYGINKLNKNNEKFTTYTENNGLANNFVYGILVDKIGNIWASTNDGISTINVNTNKIMSFNIADGLQSSEFNAYSFFKNKDGEMFFGGINGINSFYPEDLKINKYMTRVILENFYVFNNRVDLCKNINLNYNQNNFSIEYFFPDYRDNKKIKYSYKLEGVDADWNYVEDRNFANYTNVKPGNYKFKVKALNSNGIWSNETELEIKIKNPFCKTPIAYSIYFIVIVLVITFAFNRVSLLGELVKQRTEELEKKYKENNQLYKRLMENEKYKNNYFVNLSHELRTPLNVLLSSIQLITTLNKENKFIEKDKLAHYMDIMTGNSKRLLKLINNIIDTSKIESGSYRIDIKEVDIIYLVEETALSMKDFVENNNLEFIIDPEIEEKIIECDSSEIERCIVNLIANAVKFTNKGGKIEIIIKDKVNKIEIIVKDTGIGIDDKFKKAIFDRFGQAYNSISEEHGGSGLGLTVVNQLVKLHNGEIKLKSEVGIGSEFIIVLPVRQPK